MRAERRGVGWWWAWWTAGHAPLLALCLVLPCGLPALLGLGAGLQWWALRHRLAGAGDWPLVTAGGVLAAAPVLAWAFFDPANRSDAHNATLFALVAVAVGGAQWFGLRGRVAGAGWWVAASAAGGALHWVAYDAVWAGAVALYADPPARWVVARHVYFFTTGFGEPSAASMLTWHLQGAAGGIAYGAPTGLALLWLLRVPGGRGHRRAHPDDAVLDRATP